MRFYWLILGILCVWRITHLLQAEDGPWNVVVRLRKTAGEGFWGRLLDCFYCLSIWIAAPIAFVIGQGWLEQMLLWPALSAGAILLERLINPVEHIPPALYFEDKEDEHVLLRETEDAVQRSKSDHPGF